MAYSYGQQLLNDYGIGLDNYDSHRYYNAADLLDRLAGVKYGDLYPKDTSRLGPFLKEAEKVANNSQLARNRRLFSNGGTTAPEYAPTPLWGDVFNKALMHDLNRVYDRLGGTGISVYPHPQSSGRPEVEQAMSGEYLYRMLFPDEIVAPFARSYND
jgi:hypothetical protein